MYDRPMARAYRAKRRAEIKAMRQRRRADAIAKVIAAIGIIAIVQILGQCVLESF